MQSYITSINNTLFFFGRGHAYVAPVLPHRRTRTLHAVVSYVLEVEAMNHAHLLQKGGTTPGDIYCSLPLEMFVCQFLWLHSASG